MEIMMTALDKRDNPLFIFDYHTLRNISSPEDLSTDRRVYAGSAPGTSFLKLPEDENVRTYIVTAEGKKRQRLTTVHKRIRETLKNQPDEFSVLNSGITVVASSIDVDEKNKKFILKNPSIINGSQTRGELIHYFDNADPIFPVSCKFEIIVTTDDALIAEISIARNFQNDVASLSIAGRKGVLDGLENRLQSVIPDFSLKKSETDRSDSFYDTEKLLQVITALIPSEIWPKPKEKDDPKKVYTYSMKAKCLKDFQEIFDKAQNEDDNAKKLYDFYLDIAPQALKLYSQWKTHQGFCGTGLRAIQREGGAIIEVPDGIIFPIIAAMSAFVWKKNGKWGIHPPTKFSDSEIIHAAKAQYQNVAHSNPWNMGKSQSIYSSLFQITSIFRKLTTE
jgi:AIPR protein